MRLNARSLRGIFPKQRNQPLAEPASLRDAKFHYTVKKAPKPLFSQRFVVKAFEEAVVKTSVEIEDLVSDNDTDMEFLIDRSRREYAKWEILDRKIRIGFDRRRDPTL
jgi:hypothetical protein